MEWIFNFIFNYVFMRYTSFLFAVLFISSCQTTQVPIVSDGTKPFQKSILAPFYHGVASGDPLPDRVIIWTRVTPSYQKDVEVKWQMATDKTFKNIIQSGSTTTNAKKDYTVKVDVVGLQPNSTYYYRFMSKGKLSKVGRTRTTNNTGDGPLKLGVVSCSNLQFGYFSAYRHLGDKDLDLVLHLGDYFYEHGPDGYGDSTFVRKHIPPHEIVTLDDYRTRYAQYRLDKDLQYVHAQHPFIAIWDDHEITNDSYKTGAENHQPEEGDYEERKAVAKRAYYEWMPIRPNASKVLHRDFDFGSLADIIVLDERLEGRTEQAKTIEEVDASKTMLGAGQLAWFKQKLVESNAQWKIIGNQVIFSETDLSKVRPAAPKNLDAWDGYAVERDDIIRHIEQENIDHVIFVTGDTHASWAFEVPRSIEDYQKTEEGIAVEFGTPSITSSNWNEWNTDLKVMIGEQLVRSANPHLKFVNARDHGYFILTLNKDSARADWYYMDDIQDEHSEEKLAKSISVKYGSRKLETIEE